MGRSPFLSAVSHNCLRVVKYFLRLGRAANKSPLDDVDRNQWTTFHVASWYKSIDVLTYLFSSMSRSQARKRLGRVDQRGHTAIHLAAASGNVVALRKMFELRLIDRRLHDGSIVFLRDANGCTPWLFAAQKGQADTIKWFCDLAVSDENDEDTLMTLMKGSDRWGQTAIHLAASSGCLSVISVMQQSLRDNKRCSRSAAAIKDLCGTMNMFGMSPLHISAAKGYGDLVRAFIRLFGVNVDQRDSEGATALFYAVERGHVETARILVTECDASLDVKSKQGFTPADVIDSGCLREVLPFMYPDAVL